MSSDITLGDQYVWVSNQRFSTLLEFALQTGADSARSSNERRYVDRLREFQRRAWPGISFDLEQRFPDVEEKKFWAVVFHEVARRIFLRRLGDHRVTFWQSSAIGDAYVVARMLTAAVKGKEGGWYPETEDAREAGEFHDGDARFQL